ncbi:Rid family detoxifying hydrolase [Luteibaculum oceani]|uniref:RidA family protein n=1 Tax=Luteibaculum oceani TaxID=1294296 RepID=A0A5C6V8P9_9FLAO|nr:Rid family detoxifying hydrolase [Luteibaculum oceani]TXC81449.1 RidA family protein [Luteibaculum oceani]
MAKKAFNSPNAPAAVGPYSHAAWAGDTLLISGQIALDLEGNLHTSDIKTETTRVLENVKTIIETAGLTMDHIVKCSIFLSDMDNFQSVNEVYATYFGENPPARECVAVKTLPKQVNVEISVIAHR